MAQSMKLLLIALFVAAAPAEAAELRAGVQARANPIRKVVTLMQGMEKKVQAEGEKEKELFDAFTCQCKATKSDLSKSIADGDQKISSLPSDIEATEELLTQTKTGLATAKSDRAAAKTAMAEATAMRQKEAGAFASTKAEFEANIGAITKAVAAIEKGAGGAFLQTGAAQLLERFATNQKDMDEDQQDAILSFLSGKNSHGASQSAADSGEILGILKELGDDMSRSLADASGAEEKSIANYNDLMAAKSKEVAACTQAIEDKTKKIGEVGIEIVEMKDDLSDTEKQFVEDKKYLADSENNCAKRTAEFEEAVKTRADELTALADTIKMLNSDEALELFKKTLPSAGASFLQVTVSSAETKRRALAVVRAARNAAPRGHRAGFALLAVSLTGKKVNFGKVLTMIDDMVGVLKEEQADDDKKKDYCASELDATDDKKKSLARELSKEQTAIDKANDDIATLKDEMEALSAGLRALDRSVAEASELRKEENQEYNAMMSGNTAAKTLLDMAKERLNKFYAAFLQVSGNKDSNAVIGMIDTLIGDLDKEMTEGEATEKEAQKDYESMTADAKEKRAMDSKTLDQKAAVKADTESALQEHQGAHRSAKDEETATLMYEMNLHNECDWLVQNYEMRRGARTQEIESLKKAKDVLNGADFSLLQRTVTRHLRRGL